MTRSSGYTSAKENWKTKRRSAIMRVVRSLNSFNYNAATTDIDQRMLYKRAADGFWDVFVYSHNIDPERWRRGESDKKIKRPHFTREHIERAAERLGIIPGKSGALLYDENYAGGAKEDEVPPSRASEARLPEGHVAFAKVCARDDVEMEIDEYDMHLSKEYTRDNLTLDIYQLGLGRKEVPWRTLPSQRRYKKFYDEPKARLMQETNFFLTINTNRPAPDIATGDEWAELLTKAVYDLFRDFKNWLVCVKGREKDLADIDRFIESCKIAGGVEYGDVHKTLHVHLLIHILHFTRLQLVISNITRFIVNRFSKTRLWDKTANEPWFTTNRMKFFFARALDNPDVRKCKDLKGFRKPEWLDLIPVTRVPSFKERKHLQIALKRGYLKFFEDDDRPHVKYVLMPPVGWTAAILAYIFKKGVALEKEIQFIRWHDALQQEHIKHVLREHALPKDFANVDELGDRLSDIDASEAYLI